MLLRILLAVMTINAGTCSTGWDNVTGSDKSFAEDFWGAMLAIKRLVGANIPLDPRLDEIVLPDGRTLLNGRKVSEPSLAMVGNTCTRTPGASKLLETVRTTQDTTKHYNALHRMAEFARLGEIWAIEGFQSLLDSSSRSCSRTLPWTHIDDERAAWLARVAQLRRQQISGKNAQEKSTAEADLLAMLQKSSHTPYDNRDTATEVGMRLRRRVQPILVQ